MTSKTSMSALSPLGNALVRAWQGRSSVDRHAFEQWVGVPFGLHDPGAGSADHGPAGPPGSSAGLRHGLPHPVPWLTGQVGETAVAVERVAAVSGAVDPLELIEVEPASDAERGLMALDLLSAGFDRARTARGWAWTLRSDRRAVVLKDLPRDLLPGLLEQADTLKTDPAGVAFRTLLRRGQLEDSDGPPEVRLTAYSWLALIRPELAEQARVLRRERAKAVVLRALDYLLEDGFSGRAAELGKLRDFAGSIGKVAGMQVLSVTGIGGSGKSTLLAKALRPMVSAAFDDDSAPMVVSLDFDRRSLLAGAELELSFELSRQLELYLPEIGPEIGSLREAVTRERIERGEAAKAEFDSEIESLERHGLDFERRAEAILRSGLAKRPLLLVLDTFEEWQRERVSRWDSENPVRRILGWLANLQATWGLDIGAVVSGRTPVPRESRFANAGAIQLRDLKRGEILKLLKTFGLQRHEAEGVARIAGGNPLSLKLAARYYLHLPDERRAAFLGDDEDELSGVDTALRQGLLYQRFLDHIADPVARQLAHPGLTLRRVTPELVREVLAAPCGLGSLDLAESETLLERLSREVWLVENRWPVIIHRPELRTVMLRSMRTDPAQASRIQAVNRAAALWYESRPNATDEDRAEALYHRLSLAEEDPAQLIASASPALIHSVARSADDFEGSVRALLLFSSGQSVSEADAIYLPGDLRALWVQRRAEELVSTGQPERAISLWHRLGGSGQIGAWYAAAAFQSRHWRDAHIPLDLPARERRESLRYEYLLSFVLRSQRPDYAVQLRHWLRQTLGGQLEAIENAGQAVLAYEALYFASLLDRAAAFEQRRRMASIFPLERAAPTATQYLRIRAALGEVIGPPSPKMARILFAGAFRPTETFLDSLIHKLEELGERPLQLYDFRREFGAAFADGRPSSTQLLGTWSSRFAAAIAGDVEELRDPQNHVPMLLEQFVSDDPEWRVPIRVALAQAGGPRGIGPHLNDAIAEALNFVVPGDLYFAVASGPSPRSARGAWTRTVEYIDRCGVLPQLMRHCLEFGDPRLEEVARAYLDWDALRCKWHI